MPKVLNLTEAVAKFQPNNAKFRILYSECVSSEWYLGQVDFDINKIQIHCLIHLGYNEEREYPIYDYSLHKHNKFNNHNNSFT